VYTKQKTVQKENRRGKRKRKRKRKRGVLVKRKGKKSQISPNILLGKPKHRHLFSE